MTDQHDPFERLAASHGRLRERLAELERAVGGSAVALGTVQEVLAFFERSVTRHEEDEERSLFPRLAGVAEVAGAITTLEAEHARQRELWSSLGELTRRAVSGGGSPALTHFEDDEVDDLRELVRHLVLSYEGHIRLEEEALFPVARRVLDGEARRAVADEMDARRDTSGRGGGRGGSGGRHADDNGGNRPPPVD
jgi:hemerythrin-like domain-containing protein